MELANLGRETEGNAGSKLRGGRIEGITDFCHARLFLIIIITYATLDIDSRISCMLSMYSSSEPNAQPADMPISGSNDVVLLRNWGPLLGLIKEFEDEL